MNKFINNFFNLLNFFKYTVFILITVLIFLLLPFSLINNNISTVLAKDEEGFFYITKSQTIDSIAKELQKKNLTDSPTYIKYIFTICSKFWTIHYGEFKINKVSNFKIFDLMYKIFTNKRYIRKLYIPSGFANMQLFKIIDNATKLIGYYNKDDIKEGSLFPDTYNYYAFEERQRMIKLMRSKLDSVLISEWVLRDKDYTDKYYSKPEDSLTMASMLEREAKTYDDKRAVASVIMNRLDIGQKLEIDATSQYSVMQRTGKKTIPTLADLREPHSHNTYYIHGMPPTPISNASLFSIRAALHPEKTNYLYYISMPNSNSLIFAQTYSEHLKNVKALNAERSKLRKKNS